MPDRRKRIADPGLWGCIAIGVLFFVVGGLALNEKPAVGVLIIALGTVALLGVIHELWSKLQD
jgi:hypothetical protein